MSHSRDLFVLGDEVATEPSFELSLRGYDRRQVDRYVTHVEAEVAALAAEREQAYGQIQDLTEQVRQLRAEMADIRQRNGSVGKLSFRHLGPQVERIIALAEEQAEAIRAEARRQASDESRNFEDALRNRRAEAAKADQRQRKAVHSDLTAAQERARAADEHAKRIRVEAEQHAKRVYTKADKQVRIKLKQAEKDVKQLRGQAENEHRQLREQAKQEIREQRERAEQEIREQREQTEQEIREQREQAEQDHEQRRVEAERAHRRRRDQVEEELRQRRAQAEKECQALIAAARHHADEVRAEAKRQAAETERRIDELRAAAKEAATPDPETATVRLVGVDAGLVSDTERS